MPISPNGLLNSMQLQNEVQVYCYRILTRLILFSLKQNKAKYNTFETK